MDYKKITTDTISDLEQFKILIESQDQMGLEKLKAKITANKCILTDAYHEASQMYNKMKASFEKSKNEKYKEYRLQGTAIQDSTNFSKLDTIKEFEDMHLWKSKRDKMRSFIEGMTDVQIEIATTLKYMRNEIKYG